MHSPLLAPALMAYAHHLAAFVLMIALCIELVLYSRQPSLREARILQRADLWYGLSAMAVIALGLLRALYFEKGWAFYSQNGFFWTKLILLGVVALLSIYPTVRFLKWNARLREGLAPEISEREFRLTRMLIGAEVLLMVLVLLAAPLMSRGLWMWGIG